MGDEFPSVRTQAASALGNLKQATPEVITTLIKALGDEFPSVGTQAASALGNLKQATPEVITTLIKALGNELPSVRTQAALTLVQLGQESQKVIDALIKALGDWRKHIGILAISALVQLGQKLREVINILTETLKDTDPDVRTQAATVLVQLDLKSPDIIGKLIKALLDKNFYSDNVRTQAVSVLGNLKQATPEIIGTLIKVLGDKEDSYSVRTRTAAALENLQQATPEVIIALVEALRDENQYIRAQAASALGNLKQVSPKIISALIKGLGDLERGVRTQAALALVLLGQELPEVIAALINALRDSYSIIRTQAASALGNLKQVTPEVISALINTLSSDRKQATLALVQLSQKSPEVIVALIKVLKDKRFGIRVDAAFVLVQLGKESPEVIAALIKALGDFGRGSDEIRTRAASALGNLKQASPEVISWLIKALKDGDYVVRAKAVYALKKLIDQLPSLSSCLPPKKLAKVICLADCCYLFKDKNHNKLRYKVNEKTCELILPLSFSVDEFLELLQAKLRKKGYPVLERPLAKTALHLAAEKDDLRTVKELVEKGADINDQHNENKTTALMSSIEHEKIDIISYLLTQPNINCFCLDKSGFSAFNKAANLCFSNPNVGFPVLLLLIQKQRMPINLDNIGQDLHTHLVDYDGSGYAHEDLKAMKELMLAWMGIQNIGGIRKKYGRFYLAHLHSMKGGDDSGQYQSENLEGMDVPNFLALRVCHLAHLVNQIKKDLALPPGLSKSECLPVLKQEIKIAMETYRTNELIELVNTQVMGASSAIQQQFYQSLAKNCLGYLENLEEGKEFVLQTGNIQHCVYLVFERKGDAIQVRIDNLYKPNVENQHKKIDDHYCPYFIGEWKIKDLSQQVNCQNYLIILFKNKGQNNISPIYVKDFNNQGQQPEAILAPWSKFPVQSVGNCVVYSYNIGSEKRLGKPLNEWLVAQETALIADKAKLVDAAPLIAAAIQHTLMGGSVKQIRQNSQQINQTPSHEEVMQILSNLLGVPYQNVYNGDAVESALVRAAGIMTSQAHAMFRRNPDGSTRFHLNFSSLSEYKQFLNYYQENYRELIINHGEFNQDGVCEIHVNTNALLSCFQNVPPMRTLGPTRPTQTKMCCVM